MRYSWVPTRLRRQPGWHNCSIRWATALSSKAAGLCDNITFPARSDGQQMQRFRLSPSSGRHSVATGVGSASGDHQSPGGSDVIIVGGGGHGFLGAAYSCAKQHGIRNVAVAGARLRIGGGNSGRNTTIVRANYLLRRKRGAVRALGRKLLGRAGPGAEFTMSCSRSAAGGSCQAHTVHDVQSFKRHVHANRLQGIDNEWDDARAGRAILPAAERRPGCASYPVLGAALQRQGRHGPA